MTRFHELHIPGDPLVLVNAWDAGSARIVEAAGAAAVATTSAGVAWSLGYPDGDALPVDEALAAVTRIRAAVAVPVTADIEAGYGAIEAFAATGIDGINIEDGRIGPDELAARIATARKLSDGLFVNARIDTFLFGLGGLEETVTRAARYLDAGADGIFVPGVSDPAVVAALVSRIDAPVNIMVGAGSPPVKELAALGVARISFGSSVAQAAYGVVQQAARAAVVGAGLNYGDLNGLWTGERTDR